MDNPGEILRLCRLCLVKDQVNIPIFEEQGDIRQIFLKISSCLPVTVSRDDQLPKKICDGCSNKLDLLYEFWNTSANAEKTLLSWLGQAGVKDADETISAVAQQIAKPAEPQVKQEDLEDGHAISQQDNFGLQSFDEDTKDEAEPPPRKRARRTAAVKAQISIAPESDDDDDDMDNTEAMTKVEGESEESDGEDRDPSYGEVPGTSADDQAGPSGVGKDGVEAPLKISTKDPNVEAKTQTDLIGSEPHVEVHSLPEKQVNIKEQDISNDMDPASKEPTKIEDDLSAADCDANSPKKSMVEGVKDQETLFPTKQNEIKNTDDVRETLATSVLKELSEKMEITNSNLNTKKNDLQEKLENDVVSINLNSPLSKCKDPNESETLPDQFENSMTALLELQKEVSRIDSIVVDERLPEKSLGSSGPAEIKTDQIESLKINDKKEEPQKSLISTISTNISTEDIISPHNLELSETNKFIVASDQNLSDGDTIDDQNSTDKIEKTNIVVSQITTKEKDIGSVGVSGDNVGKKEPEMNLSLTEDAKCSQEATNEKENTNIDVKKDEIITKPFIGEDSKNEANTSMSNKADTSQNSESFISLTQDSDDNKDDSVSPVIFTKTRSSRTKRGKNRGMSKKVTIKKRVSFVPKILVVRLERMNFEKTSSAVNNKAKKQKRELCIKLKKCENIREASTILTDSSDTQPSILQPVEEKKTADVFKMDSVDHPSKHVVENKLAVFADANKNMSDSLVLRKTTSLSGDTTSNNETTQSNKAIIAADENFAHEKPVLDLNDINNEHVQSDNSMESSATEVVKLSDTLVDIADRHQLRKKSLRSKKKKSRKTSAKVSVRFKTRKSKTSSQHAKRLYFCEICSLSFNCIRRYWNHTNLVHHDHNFDCSLCDKKFKKTSSLLHHNKFRHKGADEVNSEIVKDLVLFYCESCGEGFRNIQKRVAHIQDVHKDGYIFCTLCDHTSSNIDDLVFHAKTHKTFKNTLFSCKICGQNIFFLQMFINHINGHCNVSTPNNFYCKICCTKIDGYEKFLTHMQDHLFTKPNYYCFICDKVFLFNKKLELHLKFQHQKQYLLYKKFLTLKDNQKDAGKFDCYCCGQNVTDKCIKKHLRMHKCFWLTLKNKQQITNNAKVCIKKKSLKVLKNRPALLQKISKDEGKGLNNERAETKTNDDILSSIKIKDVSPKVKSIISDASDLSCKSTKDIKTKKPAGKMEENKLPVQQRKKTDEIFKKPAIPPISDKATKSSLKVKGLKKEVIQPAIDKSKVIIIERKFDLTGTSEAFKKVDDVLSTKEEITEKEIDKKHKQTAENKTSTKSKDKKKSRFAPIEPTTATQIVAIKKQIPTKITYVAPKPGLQKNQGPPPRGPFVGPPFGGPFPRGPPSGPPFRGPHPWGGPSGGPPFGGPPGGPQFGGPPGGPQFGGPPGGPNFGGPGGPNFGGPLGQNFAGPPGPNFGGPVGPNFGGSGGPNFGGPGGPNFMGPSGPNFGGSGGLNFEGPSGPNFGGPGDQNFVGPGGSNFGGPPFVGPTTNVPPPRGPPPSGFNPTIHPPNANMKLNFGPPGVDPPGTNQPFGGPAPVNQGFDMSNFQQGTDPSFVQEKFFNHPGFINQLKQVHGVSGEVLNQGLPIPDSNQYVYSEQDMAIYMAQWQAHQNLAHMNDTIMPSNFGIAPPPDIIKAPVLSSKCSGCQKKFPNIKVLGVHEIFCAKLTDKLIQKKQHTCSVCSQKFSKLGVIKQHMFIAHAEIFKQLNLITGKKQNAEINQCKTCKQTFNNTENLKAHEKTHEFLQSLQVDLSKAQASATISKAPQLVSDIRPSTTTPVKGNVFVSKFDISSATKSKSEATRQREEPVKLKKDELKSQSHFKKSETSKPDKTQKATFKQTSSVQQKLNETLRHTQELEISRKIQEHKLFESIKGPAVKKNPEPNKKKLKINLLYFQKQKLEKEKQVKNLEMLKAEEELQKIQKQLIESQSFNEREKLETIDLTETSEKQKPKEDKSRIGERLRKKRSRSRSQGRTRRSRSRSRENRSGTTKLSKERRRSTEKGKKQKMPRRSRSRSKGRRRKSPSPKTSRRRSRSRSVERKIATGSKTKPENKSKHEAGAYRCPKCATLFSNYRDFIVHKDVHEGSSEDEENYLTLLDPPPPPVISGSLKQQSAAKATYDMFKQKRQESSDSDDSNEVSYSQSVSKQTNRPQYSGSSFLQKQRVVDAEMPSSSQYPKAQLGRSFSSVSSASSESTGSSRLFTSYAHLQPKQKYPARVKCQVCSKEFPGQEYLDYHSCPGPF